MTIEPALFALEACHQCGLPSLTFDDFTTPISSLDPADTPVDAASREEQGSEEPRPEAFLPAADF